MNIVIVGRRNGHFCQKNTELISQLRSKGHNPVSIYRAAGDKRNIMDEIRRESPKMLITEDLEGFEMCTLTDAVSYNLLHCRQLHFLFDAHPANEKYLSKQLSLLMTFVCMDGDRADALLSKYPDIPEVISVNEEYTEDELIGSMITMCK